jgi:hypothetical protein
MWTVPPSLSSETFDDGSDAISSAPNAKLRKAQKAGGPVTTLAIGDLGGYGTDHGTVFFARWVDARNVETISTPAGGAEPRDLLSVSQSLWLGQILADAKHVYVAERKSEDPGYRLRVIDR